MSVVRRVLEKATREELIELVIAYRQKWLSRIYPDAPLEPEADDVATELCIADMLKKYSS